MIAPTKRVILYLVVARCYVPDACCMNLISGFHSCYTNWGERSEAPLGRYICDFPYNRRTSDCSNFALRRSARRLTAHAHRCVKLKQGRVIDMSLIFLCGSWLLLQQYHGTRLRCARPTMLCIQLEHSIVLVPLLRRNTRLLQVALCH